jgi:hypothetical protein
MNVMNVAAVVFSLFQISGAMRPSGTREKDVSQGYKEAATQLSGTVQALKPGTSNNLDQYEKVNDELFRDWRTREPEDFAKLMLSASGPLSAGRFGDARQFDLARKYLIAALENRNSISVMLELHLATTLASASTKEKLLADADFGRLRGVYTDTILKAFKRIVNSIDPHWDPQERISLQPDPPRGLSSYDSGMSPDHISDPKLRAQYEAAIKENDRKNAAYTEQSQLRNWLKPFQREAESYIVHAYSEPPEEVAELRKLLEKYVADAETRERILGAVTKNWEQKRGKN